jgi:hypothetical protein
MMAPIALFKTSVRPEEIQSGIAYGVRARGMSLRISAHKIVSSIYWRADTMNSSFWAGAG